jgi:hypothetical protein
VAVLRNSRDLVAVLIVGLLGTVLVASGIGSGLLTIVTYHHAGRVAAAAIATPIWLILFYAFLYQLFEEWMLAAVGLALAYTGSVTTVVADLMEGRHHSLWVGVPVGVGIAVGSLLAGEPLSGNDVFGS